MKKYLRIINVLLLAIYLLTHTSNNAFAGEIKQRYYEGLVSGWGYNITPKITQTTAIITTQNQFLQDLNINQGIIQKTNENKTETSIKPKETNAEITITTNPISIMETENILVQTKDNYEFIFYTGTIPFSTYETKSFYTNGDKRDGFEYYIFIDNQTTKIAINTNLVISANTYILVNGYFRALSQATNQTNHSASEPKAIYISNFTLETIYYALILFVFGVAVYKIGLFINLHRSRSLNIIFNHAELSISKLLIWSKIIRPYGFLALFFLLSLLAYLAILLSYSNQGEINILYILDKVMESMDLKNDITVLKNKELLNIAILLILRHMQVIFALILLPSAIEFLQLVTKLKSKLIINTIFIKHLFIILLLTLFYVLLLFDIKKDYVLPVLLFAFITIIFVIFLQSQFPTFNSKEKKYYVTITILIILLSLGYKVNQYKNPAATLNDLFASNAKTIFLPYIKEIEGVNPKIIQKKVINETKFPIFANNYLIYHPDYSELKHINVTKLDQIGDDSLIIIHPNEPKTMLSILLSSDQLRNYYISSSPTSAIYFKNMDEKSIDQISINVEINCYDDISPSDLFLSYLDSNDSKSKIKNVLAAKFSGCNKDEITQTIVIQFTDILYLDKYIFLLSGVDTKYIKSITIFANNNLQNIEYLDYNPTKKLKELYNTGSTNVAIISVENQITLSLTSPIKSSESGINLADNVDILYKAGLIGTTIEIWSPEPHALIYNKLDN